MIPVHVRLSGLKPAVVLAVAVCAVAACSKAPPPAPPAPAAETPAARELPPPPGEPRSFTIPAPSEKTLANGLRVIVLPRHANPLVTAEFNLLSGGEIDPPKLAGLADFTANLLTQGTRSRSAPQIAQAAETLGGSIKAEADWNATRIGITVTTPKSSDALALLADVVRNPAFAKAEVERQRAQALDALRVSFSQPGALARFVGSRVAYGDAPYGHSRIGTPASLARIKSDDLLALHRRYYRPDNAVLIFAGDIEPEAAFALAERSFGDWTKPDDAIPESTGASTRAGLTTTGKVIAIDLPGAGQAAVLAIERATPRSAPDHYPGLIANAVLGGGYSARLNEEIRIKRGLSYGASSRLLALRDAGTLVAAAQTKNESAAQVVELVRAELAKLSTDLVPADELKARKASLIGTYSRNLETSEGIAAQLGTFVTLGIDLTEIGKVIDAANGISAEQIKAYAVDHLAPAGTNIVVVGDGKQIVPALQKAYPDLIVIPAAQLDLERADLGAAPVAKQP